MGDARAVTERIIHVYRNVPAEGPGVCRICHTGPNDAPITKEPWWICSSCDRTTRGLYRHAKQVVPISLCVQDDGEGALYAVVARKRSLVTSKGRTKRSTVLAATIARFYEAHASCLSEQAGGPFTLVTTIPSTHPDPPARAHIPMSEIATHVGALQHLYQPTLRPNYECTPILAERCSHPDAFQPTEPINRLNHAKVLLLDDLFVSGAHIQSAASALYQAGADIVVALVVARLIKPGFNPHRARIWEQAESERFSFERCCLCAPSADRTA
ncbi:phosphoribosyltransferase [Nonomuraea zeae]|uniref:Phosphoribosyltransferase n=1 Tax=Nonomuraea zeae TaxID=1642303 RepID=A0A5S4GRW4_9ACTN|nr:phosphoribosyltransferase [Nonomuraea zeae]TMR35569.1 phosphoribosyltransferase [Nonomuraea zeae]